MAEVEAVSKVCMTGGEGSVGSYLVKTLLSKGYDVHATVLSISASQFLLSLAKRCGKQNNLKLFEANLWDDGSFDSAVEGCVENKGLDAFVGILCKDFPQYVTPLWNESKGRGVLQVSQKRLHELCLIYKHDLTNIIHDSFDKYGVWTLPPPLD